MKAFNYEKFFIFLFDEEATAMAEYALILALITVTIAAVVTTLGARICQAISNATTAIPS